MPVLWRSSESARALPWCRWSTSWITCLSLALTMLMGRCSPKSEDASRAGALWKHLPLSAPDAGLVGTRINSAPETLQIPREAFMRNVSRRGSGQKL